MHMSNLAWMFAKRPPEIQLGFPLSVPYKSHAQHTQEALTDLKIVVQLPCPLECIFAQLPGCNSLFSLPR